jgi:hypothetical protein
MRGLLNRLFGYRWSLYIVQEGNVLFYALRDDSVISILSHIVDYYARGDEPVPPWSLHLNFNKTHTSIQLLPEHFTPTALAGDLCKHIASIDPEWRQQRASSESVFTDAATNKPIDMHSNVMKDFMMGREQVDFYSVMHQVFGK